MTTPALELETLFTLDAERRITSTREPGGSRGPLFCLIRGVDSSAWAVRADVPRSIADELLRFAQREPATSHFKDAPVYAADYISLLADRLPPDCDVGAKRARSDGPAFVFPETLLRLSGEVMVVEDEAALAPNFRGVGARGASIGTHSALQHRLDERRVAGRGAQVGSDHVRERLESWRLSCLLSCL